MVISHWIAREIDTGRRVVNLTRFPEATARGKMDQLVADFRCWGWDVHDMRGQAGCLEVEEVSEREGNYARPTVR